MTRLLVRWLGLDTKSACEDCGSLLDAQQEAELVRLEYGKTRDKLEQVSAILEATRGTNIDLGHELERRANEMRCAEVELGKLRRQVKELTHKLEDVKAECTVLWAQKAEMQKEIDTYKVLVRVNELQQTEVMRSRSNCRQQQIAKREYSKKN